MLCVHVARIEVTHAGTPQKGSLRHVTMESHAIVAFVCGEDIEGVISRGRTVRKKSTMLQWYCCTGLCSAPAGQVGTIFS